MKIPLRFSCLPILIAGILVVFGCDGDGDGAGTTPNPSDRFLPGADTTLSGSARFSQFEIPAGISVTVAADAEIDVSGSVVIQGSLTAPCRALSIRAGEAMRVEGTIENHCSPQSESARPPLSLLSTGEFEMNGATITSSGDVRVGHATAATGSVVNSGRVLAASQSSACQVLNSRFETLPRMAPPPAEETVDGSNGTTWTVACSTDLLIGALIARGQAGSDGQEVVRESSSSLEVTGGAGGVGGSLRFRSTGTITFEGTTILETGDGGDGGDAIARGTPADGSSVPSTSALSGDGGNAGRVFLEAPSVENNGTVRLQMGSAGSGGDASAEAADGLDATVDRDATSGGSATAIGGSGGSILLGDLISLMGEGLLLDPAQAGRGGNGSVRGGTGGAGLPVRPSGGPGGEMNALGGDGGANELPEGRGGDAGSIFLTGSHGGPGATVCARPNGTAGLGGDGGAGGSANGAAGVPGAAAIAGEGGEAVVIHASNGGDGGDGEPPGEGGPPGDRGIEMDMILLEPPNFTDGNPGGSCPAPQTFRMSGSIAVPEGGDPAGHDPDLFDAGSGSGEPGTVPGRSISLRITRVGNQIFIEGPDPWITVEGTLSPTGSFVATGRGTVKGVEDSRVEFRGTFSPSRLSGEYEMQPGDQPSIVYKVEVFPPI